MIYLAAFPRPTGSAARRAQRGAKTPPSDVPMAVAGELGVEVSWLFGQHLPNKTGGTASGPDATVSDHTASARLRDLASDQALSAALSIIDAEWRTRYGIRQVWASGLNLRSRPLLHHRCLVGLGPSSKTCPWCPPQRAQWYSVRGQISL